MNISDGSEQIIFGLTQSDLIAIIGTILVPLLVWYLAWWLPGFRPYARAFIDDRGQRIKVIARNRGRTSGSIESVTFVHTNAQGNEVSQDYKWKRVGDFSSNLGGNGTVYFVAESVADQFAEGTLVRVTTNKGIKNVNPRKVKPGESFDLEDILIG